MNDFFNNGDLYELTADEGRRNAGRAVKGLLYLVLTALVIITAAHAVMLVLSQAGTYRFAGQSGLVETIMTGIRIAFPIIVEAAAVVAGLGFIQSRWRGPQKSVGLSIELVWIVFAAANMITFFAVERGQELQSWQVYWVEYGLPLSALIAGALVYMLVRADPDHTRAQEEAAAAERVAGVRFKARHQALLSPAMTRIEFQRAWMDTVKQLRSAGYTEEQIRFMTQYTPELLVDADGNGRPDVLDTPAALPTHLPTNVPARPPVYANGTNGQHPNG